MSTGVNTAVASSVGQQFIGQAGAANNRIESGFLVIIRQRVTVGIEEGSLLPSAYALHQNYPNPFNPTTTIRFDLPRATDIHIVVYDLLGREVVRLLNQHLEPGFHELIWNGKDRTGRHLPSGMYIVLMATPEFRKSIKMVLLK
ncbi:MAG: T9SS type A sorting domain-containing protein [Candidatus Marinimicrobia bacterium]|nr:T9SS type A sorting domain-containing protein [Candidatus Neomarinimicrobiota bacterium]